MTQSNEPINPTLGFEELRDGPVCTTDEPGLTKREHFASLAMQSLLSSDGGSNLTTNQLTEDSVKYADALIAELNKEK